MSCPKDTNLTVKDEFGNLIAPIVTRISKCKGRKSKYPSFTPVIDSTSINTSTAGVYTVVYITGSNFLPPCNGNTYVNFGSYTNLPIVFYNSFNISFVVPINAVGGTYQIKVVNIYNDNFALPVSQSYPGIPNYSNSVSFNITNISYSLFGTYTISSNSEYNTIIDFTGNGMFTILSNYNTIPINFIAVGGGGGGGGGINLFGCGGGGGGGGGIATGTFGFKNSYAILIGNGGTGGSTGSFPANGTSGGSTQITGVVSVPGGGEGRTTNSSPFGKGGNSGNGGAGGTGNINPGANGTNGGGGGGGTSGVPTGYNGGNGSITSTSVYLYGTSFGAGGGGGGGSSISGTSSSGVGGNIYAGNGGNGNTGVVGNGVANYGGGGGGGISGNGASGSNTKGGNGGSGRVVLYFNN